MNKFNPPIELPLLLGAKVIPPAPVPVTTVELKPHLFLNKLTGRMAYLPPEPTTPEKAKKPKLATPPVGEAMWHFEDPTEDGWYVATRSHKRPTNRARYWDGKWSHYLSAETLMKYPSTRDKIPTKTDLDDFVWLCKLEFPA